MDVIKIDDLVRHLLRCSFPALASLVLASSRHHLAAAAASARRHRVILYLAHEHRIDDFDQVAWAQDVGVDLRCILLITDQEQLRSFFRQLILQLFVFCSQLQAH